ncbi:hypothetical protein EJ07DRAFT_151896 [Lizonia empirigonia]|nr:hypothetical protein EJ07DRAFT_151896 [Lizonia empirigonia]
MRLRPHRHSRPRPSASSTKPPSVLRYTLILLKARPTPTDIAYLCSYTSGHAIAPPPIPTLNTCTPTKTPNPPPPPLQSDDGRELGPDNPLDARRLVREYMPHSAAVRPAHAAAHRARGRVRIGGTAVARREAGDAGEQEDWFGQREKPFG